MTSERLKAWSCYSFSSQSAFGAERSFEQVRLRRAVPPAFALRGFDQCLWNDVILGRIDIWPHHAFTLYDVVHCNKCYFDSYPCDEEQHGHAALHWDSEEGFLQIDLPLQDFLRAVFRWFFVHLPAGDDELLKAFQYAESALLEDMTRDLRLAFPEETHTNVLTVDIVDRSRELWDTGSPMNTWLYRCWERLWLVRCNSIYNQDEELCVCATKNAL